MPVLCGLGLALVMAAGCGPKAAPPAPPKPKTEAPKTAATAVPTNIAEQYVSVFEDLPRGKGRNPFFPNSHMGEPAPEAAPQGEENVHVEPVLSLRAVIGHGRHSQVVINNEIFEVGETQSVRVPNGHVRVRCLEVSNNSALVQVEGEAGPKRLVIEQKKTN
jgi:hypothetical protein